MNACACLGPACGEPYCACRMKSMGLEHVMDANPLRQAEEERSAKQWAEFMANGGFEWLTGGNRDDKACK